MEPLDPKSVMEYVKDLKEFLESSNIFERRAFLGNFIESIEADDGEMTFNYTLPLPPDNTRQETVSVLGFVPLSGAEGTRTPDLLRAREALSQLSHSPTQDYNNKRPDAQFALPQSIARHF